MTTHTGSARIAVGARRSSNWRARLPSSRGECRATFRPLRRDHAAAEDANPRGDQEDRAAACRGEPVEHPLAFACARARNVLRNEHRVAARLLERLMTDRPYGRVRVERRARASTLTPRRTDAQAAARLGFPRSAVLEGLERPVHHRRAVVGRGGACPGHESAVARDEAEVWCHHLAGGDVDVLVAGPCCEGPAPLRPGA